MIFKIFENGELVNRVVAENEAVMAALCEGSGLTYEAEEEPVVAPSTTPTALEQLRADVDYIAMETGVEL